MESGSTRSLSITQICHFIVGLVEEFTFACFFLALEAALHFTTFE